MYYIIITIITYYKKGILDILDHYKKTNQTFQTRIKKVKKLINFGVKKTGNKILQFFAIFNEILHFLA